jgi:xylan 1,4-beta-xylosidase
MGIAEHLRGINDGFRIVSSYPELGGKPIIIGESDPEGCAACQGPALAYRNGTMYSSYTAASFARKHDLAERHGVNLQGALTWAFEFEDQPYFAGFRSLASNGIDKPVLNVFRMFSKMSGQRLQVNSDGARALDDIIRHGVREKPDVSALASAGQQNLQVLVWHYHDDDMTGPDATVELTLDRLPIARGEIRLQHFRIDDEHSNAYSTWKQMGSPQNPNPDQYAALESAGQLAALGPPKTLKVENGTLRLEFTLPRQAVSLLELDWNDASK